MNFSEENLNNLGKEIVEWVKNKYVLDTGLVSVGIKDGKVINNNLLADLGDYLPFLYLFGAHEFCEEQIIKMEKILKNNSLPSAQKKYGLDLTTSYEYTDLLLGLIDYYEISNRESAKFLIDKIFDNVVLKFNLNKIPNSFYLDKLNIRLPIVDTRDGTFVELMLEWYRISGNEKYKNYAVNLFNRLISLDFYKKNFIFPVYEYVGPFKKIINKFPKFNDVVLMKHNTNTLYAFLDLYKETKDEKVKSTIYEWLNAVNKKMMKNGLIYNKLDGDTSLTANHSMIDFLCDCGMLFEDTKLIHKAECISEFWLEKQSGVTGLFPKTAESNSDDLDCCTDMIVALMKLYELTGKEVYKDSAKKCFAGIIKYHRKEGGYCLSVNIDNGQTADGLFKTKFITLFLKAIYLFMEDKKIYQNKKLFNLLKDR